MQKPPPSTTTSTTTTSTSSSSTSSSPSSPPKIQLYRCLTLTSLLFSDGSYTILRRYSRGVLNETYSVNDVLLVAELIKMGFSCYMMSRAVVLLGKHDDGDDDDDRDDDDDKDDVGKDALLASSKREKRRTNSKVKVASMSAHYLMNLLLRSKKMLILALIYGVGNVLSYYALAQIGAGTFVVIANLKTLTTAGFSVGMLGRTYSSTKWRALILLVVGVVLFVLPTLEREEEDGSDGEDMIDVDTKDRQLENNEEPGENEDENGEIIDEGDNDVETAIEESFGYSVAEKGGIVLGVALELVVVTLSGFASIYFEKAIKNDPLTIWERNFQLGFYSILIYISLILLDSGMPFSNWTTMASILSVLGATGGLLVALSIKYGDSVLKTLAISGSIIYANIVDHFCFGGPLDQQMILSAVVVVIAVLNYNFDAS